MQTPLFAGLAVGMTCAAATVAIAAERLPVRRQAQPSALTMAVVGACGLDEEIMAMAREEARRVWLPAGVAIQWVDPWALPFESGGADWLVVRCGGAPPLPIDADEPRVLPIAAIRFVGSLPTNVITLSPQNADTLLQQDASEGRDPRGWVMAFRRLRLARMLGRALAHEVGHFLTQSRSHTRGGLMRATHTVAALTGVSLGPFRVDPAQVAPVRIARGRTGAPES